MVGQCDSLSMAPIYNLLTRAKASEHGGGLLGVMAACELARQHGEPQNAFETTQQQAASESTLLRKVRAAWRGFKLG